MTSCSDRKVSDVNLVLGIGCGRCGSLSLAKLLNSQPGFDVTHESRPLLPWRADHDESVVKAKIGRLLTRDAGCIGDIASYYLPYVEQFLREAPHTRVICLWRDCEEVVRSFCRWSDRAHSRPTDHWSKSPASGLFHDPVWSTIFPKYDTTSREEGIRRYWHEYYEYVSRLQTKYPENVRQFEMNTALNTEAGQREVLDFVGVPADRQVLQVGLRTHESQSREPSGSTTPARDSSTRTDPADCVILVPHGGQIVPGCEDSLRVLEERGYAVRRVPGYAQIDVARNEIASKAMLDGFLETIWIDSDIGFHPDAVEKLRAHDLPLVCGIYAKKGQREFACKVVPGTQKMLFGRNGGLHEVWYAATGFFLVRRQVYLDIQFKLNLPLCNESFGGAVIPYFMPMTRPHNGGSWYLGEDYAFCERTRQVGYKIFADTTIRLWHIGNYRFGWEDAGRDPPRFADYTYHFDDT